MVGEDEGKSQTRGVPLWGEESKTWRSDSWLSVSSFGFVLGLVSLCALLVSGLAPSLTSFLLHSSVHAQYSPFSSSLPG